jgi:hypothetical protein
MATGLSDIGEEFLIKSAFRDDIITEGANLQVTLYNESTDLLADGDDLGAVTTEPAGSAYARQSVALDTAEITTQLNPNNNFEAVLNQVSYDTSDSSQTVDGYLVTANFTSDVAGDSSATEHIILRGTLGTSSDLSQIDTFKASNTGLSVN